MNLHRKLLLTLLAGGVCLAASASATAQDPRGLYLNPRANGAYYKNDHFYREGYPRFFYGRSYVGLPQAYFKRPYIGIPRRYDSAGYDGGYSGYFNRGFRDRRVFTPGAAGRRRGPGHLQKR